MSRQSPPINWYSVGEKSILGHCIFTDSYDFEELWNLHPEEYGEVILYGKRMKTPRWQQSYDLPYNFSGMLHDALPLPDQFKPFLDWANSLGLGEFNQKLINWYSNGHHYIGAHSDDEKQLVPNSPIVSISLGAERKFRLRLKGAKGIYKDILLPDRTALIMAGQFQKELTHEIVKISGKKGEKVGRRINITFRQFAN